MEFKMPYHRNPVVKKVWWDEGDGNLHWEIDRRAGKKVLKGKFVKDLVLLTHQQDVEGSLLKFIGEYGPLWAGNSIRGLDALSDLLVLGLIADTIEGFRLLDVPPLRAQKCADLFVFRPLEEWLKKWKPEDPVPIVSPKHRRDLERGLLLAHARCALENFIPQAPGSNEPRRKKYVLWKPPYPLAFGFPLVAVEDTPEFWPRFRLPKKPLDTWGQKKRWFLEELGRNVCELLRENMEFYPAIVSDPEGLMGRASICVRCKDAYTFAIARLMFEWRYRKCPVCGEPAIGSTCGSSRCIKENLKTAPKQRVLDYLYRQKARDKITEEQYEFCKLQADEFFWEDEAKDPLELMQEVVASMKDEWPDKDFSFILKGFGSRTRKVPGKRSLSDGRSG